MRTVAVICEYNPFHNGHKYCIEQARLRSGADAVICIMSGSFVQRGECAILPRFTRARHAVQSGADVVIELPACSSFFNAEQFAQTGIKVADYLNVDYIAFGSESDNLQSIEKIADVLSREPEEYKTALKSGLDEGLPFPSAREKALKTILPDMNGFDFSAPNDLLAIAYVTAIKRAKSRIIPIPIKRIDNGRDSDVPINNMLSSSAIRKLVLNGKTEEIREYVPQYVYDDLKNLHYKSEIEDMLLLSRLKTIPKRDLNNIYDVNEGLENRISECAKSAKTYQEYLESVKTKRYTLSRLKRISLYALFNVTDDYVKTFMKASPYARILAIGKKQKSALLSLWRDKKNLIGKYKDLNNADPICSKLYEFENQTASITSLITDNLELDSNMVVL